jgi:transposase-like protein
MRKQYFHSFGVRVRSHGRFICLFLKFNKTYSSILRFINYLCKKLKMETELKQYQEKILERLLGQFKTINTIDIQEFTPRTTMVCHKCKGNNFVKNGVFKNRQRYKCKDCQNTQFPDVNTALHNLKLKDKWVDFVYIMLDKEQPYTCQKISDLLEINIKTAHQWRHKFLTAISEVEPIGDSQEIELDEIYLPFCVKGRIGKEKYDE